MTPPITPISKMITLVRREYQEQRILFLLLPLFISLMVTAALAIMAIRAYMLNLQFVGLIGNRIPAESRESVAQALQAFSESSMDIKVRFWEQFYSPTLPILYISFWGAMFYYFQMTLFSQRRDRSILFWNSLPVTNTETIFSKLMAGFVLGHVIYMLSLFVMQLLMMIVMMAYTAMFDISVWENVVAPSWNHLSRFGYQVGFSFLSIFWCLPVYAWLLLTSARAKSAPFAWAMAPVVLLVVGELILFGSGDVILVLMEHSIPIINLGISPVGSLTDRNVLFSGEMLLSILLGVAFIYGAIRLNRSEDL